MSRSVQASEALALAERAFDLVSVRSALGLAAAEKALSLARERGDAKAEAAALHALGYARYAINDPRALPTIRAAIRVAERDGNRHRAALARRNLAMYLAYAGNATTAVREIDAACAALDGIDRARGEVHRIAVFGLVGRTPRGGDTARALRTLRRAHDHMWEAHVLYNRGTALSDAGDVAAATRDLAAAKSIYVDLGAKEYAVDAEIALARLQLLDGHPTECLAKLDAIEAAALSARSACWSHLARAEAHLALRLLREARDNLNSFVEALSRARGDDSVRKAQLDAVRLRMLAGDLELAASLARRARNSFAARGQLAHRARASSLTLEADLARGAVRRSMLRTGREAAAALGAQGFAVEALRTRLRIAQVALELGSLRVARREAEAAIALRRRGTIADRVGSWQLEARLRLAEGNEPGGERALRYGLRLLEDYRAGLGAVELRATASALGVELAERGLRLALDAGKPAKILGWAELLRGNALRLPLVRPSFDPLLRRRQNELRRVAAKIRIAEQRGLPLRGLAAKEGELEAAIRARTRQTRGDGVASAVVPRPRQAARALRDRVLVEYVELDGALRAVTLAHGRLALHDLGDSAAATEQLEWLRVALRRLAMGDMSPALRAATLGSATAAADQLDRLLVQPLLPILRDAPIVVVPTGVLHALPWGMLPSLLGRPVVVAPSLSHWLYLESCPRVRARKTALVAGPRLRHAGAEVRDLRTFYPRAVAVSGAAATTTAVLRALDGAALAHVACHGHFRSDSPLFSNFELADGPLTAFDLQQLRRAPDLLVLSTCDLALSERHPGDELLGLTAALLNMGTRTIVASVVPVRDGVARRVMVAFHLELAKGFTPAVALAHAQTASRRRSASLAGFVCLGSG